MARRIGVSVSSLYAYLDGTTLPPADILDRLLDTIGVADALRPRLVTARDVLETRCQPEQAGAPTPAQLPAAVAGFTGRVDALESLGETLPADLDTAPAPVVISAIAGTAGVGKTALAVYWARQVAHRFPDGQLYMNLRGFDSGESPVDPATAVRGFLDVLHVPTERIPSSVDAQVGLYRSVLAHRRMLVVLDNARDAEHVRPLLPGSPGCLAVVTSRNQMAGLAAEGAHLLTLDLLTATEARDLLASRLGQDRVAAEPDAVDDIITSCARLPLALAIVAARAAAHPDFPLTALAAQLRVAGGGLDVFASGDPATDVRTVFSWSYDTLGLEAARLFRLLAMHPGPDISTPAAASLAGAATEVVRQLLAELTGALLITEHTPDRYTFHDLLRAYASELTNAVDPEAERSAALHRLLDSYLHTAHAAALLLWPSRNPISLSPPHSGTTPQQLSDRGQAHAWFVTDHAVLLAVIAHAADRGFDRHAWQLAWTLEDSFDRRGHWHDLAAAQRIGLRAAVRLGDLSGQAHTHRGLARACLRQERYDDARTHLRHAFDRYSELGDQVSQADTTRNVALVLTKQGRYQEALAETERALALYPAGSHPAGRAQALNGIGWLHAVCGEYRQALSHCQRALALLQEINDRVGLADTWDSLGYAHHHLRDHEQAITCYQNALDLYRDLDYRYLGALTLIRLGDTHHAAGHPTDARETWRRALIVLDDLEHPDADKLRAKLDPTTT